MKRPVESDYTSHVAYCRELEAYCDGLEALQAKLEVNGKFMQFGNSEDARNGQSQPEPFGYFRAEPFGWTDCAETDEGAIPLYEKPDIEGHPV